MALSKVIKQTSLDNFNVAFRPSQTYLSATGAYTIFQVVGGAIEAISLVGLITGVAVGAVTIAVTANGVDASGAGVACNGAVGTVVYIALNTAGTTLNAAAIPKTIATTPQGMLVGLQPAGPGLIVATYVAGTSLVMEWSLVYRKLNQNSRII